MKLFIFHLETIQVIAVNICSALIVSIFTIRNLFVISFYVLGIITLYLLSVKLSQIIKKYD
ncbi:MAG: hypothetical protein ACD_12C00206G0008 [uncultured bacterium]|nr:MAG: hypothetical protein ACD_12C00206G0008 [uncultured bacterium]